MAGRVTLLVLFPLIAAGEPGPPPHEVRLDRNGYPLPAGAVARLGTPWPVQHQYTSVAWSADGRRIVFAGWEEVTTLDAATGRVVESHAIDVPGRHGADGLARDGRLLVRVADDRAWLIDVRSGDTLCAIRLPALPDEEPQTSLQSVSVSADGRFATGVLAAPGKPGPAWWLDLARGTGSRIGDRADVLSVHLAPDGRRAVGTTQGRDRHALVVWDPATGREQGAIPLSGPMTVRAVSGDGQRVAVAGDGRLQVFDAGSLKGLMEVPYRPRWDPPLGSMAFSPDGRLLAQIDSDQVVVWDVAAGKARHKFPHPAWHVTFAPDGRSLVTASGWVQRWDLETGKPAYPAPRLGYETVGAPHLRWTPDGGRLLVCWAADRGPLKGKSPEATLEVWDTVTAAAVWRQPVPAVPLAVALDLAGTTVRACTPDDRLRVWTLGPPAAETSTDLRPRAAPPDYSRHTADFYPDGRLITITRGEQELTVDLYDPAGKPLERRSGPYRDLFQSWAPYFQHTPLPDQPGVVLRRDLRREDLGTGRPLPPLQDPKVHQEVEQDFPIGGGPALVGFLLKMPNFGHGWEPGGMVWDTLTGQVVSGLSDRVQFASGVILSPDGRWVAGISQSGVSMHEMRLEMDASGRGRPTGTYHRAAFPARRAIGLSFSPDSRRLATVQDDGTVLLWDVPRPTPASWQPAEADTLWADLGADAPRSWRALWRLLDQPDRAAEVLKERLRPVPGPKDARGLIARLDDPKFAAREEAARELAGYGEAVEGDLREALRKPASAEQRERLAQLVDRLPKGPAPTGEILRGLRCVWLLEQLGTPAAKRLLRELAGGAPGARVTSEAKAALDRPPK